MGNSPHLLLIQQHHGPHNRPHRRRDHIPKRGRPTRESRPTTRNTLRRHASSGSRGKDRERQRNHLSPHTRQGSRRARRQNTWSRSTSSDQNARPTRVPNRPNRRRNTCPARWDSSAWRPTRTKSLNIIESRLHVIRSTDSKDHRQASALASRRLSESHSL